MANIWTILQFVFLLWFPGLHPRAWSLFGRQVSGGDRSGRIWFWLSTQTGKAFHLEGGTEFTLNWIPFGGFVRPKGEADADEPGGLLAAPRWKRFLVLVAGATMNFLLAFCFW